MAKEMELWRSEGVFFFIFLLQPCIAQEVSHNTIFIVDLEWNLD